MVNIIKCRPYMISNMVHINRLLDIQFLHYTTISLYSSVLCKHMTTTPGIKLLFKLIVIIVGLYG